MANSPVRFSEQAESLLTASPSLLPGVSRLIQHLKANNIPIAVATSSRRRNYVLKTAHHSQVFSCFDEKIVCGDDVHYNIRSKPEPDIFLAAANLLGRDVGVGTTKATDLQIEERRKGLVFEDAIPGLQAGKRAGMAGEIVRTLQCCNFTIYASCLGSRPKFVGYPL